MVRSRGRVARASIPYSPFPIPHSLLAMCHLSPTGGVDEARVEEHRVTLGQRELYEVLLVVLLEMHRYGVI